MTTTIRFMQGTGWASRLIVLQEKTAMPFTPSHVEILTPDGKFYFGSMRAGGVMRRPVGYDAGRVATDPVTGRLRELLLPLPTTPEQEARGWAWAKTKLDEPYDSAAIFGFVIPWHEHTQYHAICSAFVTLWLRAAGWLAFPVTAPAHLIDPRDLLLGLSFRVHVPM
jgi:hypothetical protein